jgi:RNA polymerase sigma factor (sigma-70 family)
MRDNGSPNGSPRSTEWDEMEANAADVRRRLARTVRRELVHDPRATAVRLQNLASADLADEAFAWSLENWKAKPAAVSPEQWMRKHALQILDEALDREALAAESRAQERVDQSRVLAHELPRDEDEREGWMDIADLATRAKRRDVDGGDDDPFDGLEGDPLVSSPAVRLDARETLVELERALLTLPERRRKVVAHRFLDGLEIEEIAYLLDVPVADVRAEIVSGLAELQRSLAGAPRAA